MSAFAVVAYHPGEPSRAHPFELVRQFWQEAGIPFCVTDGVTPGRPYNVGASKNQGVELLPDWVWVVVLADADTIPASYSQVAEAVWRASDAPGLVYCADSIRCLTAVETETCSYWRDAIGRRGDGGRETDSMSGLIAIRRDCFAEVEGFDAGYAGYGFEDLAFRRECASRWPVRSIPGEAIHFWHEPDPGKAPESSSFLQNEARWAAGQA